MSRTIKSFRDGHVKLRVEANSYGAGRDVSASVAVDMLLDVARQLHTDLGAAIEKEAAKVAARQEREARRKAWREREIAAGRMQRMSLADIFGK